MSAEEREAMDALHALRGVEAPAAVQRRIAAGAAEGLATPPRRGWTFPALALAAAAVAAVVLWPRPQRVELGAHQIVVAEGSALQVVDPRPQQAELSLSAGGADFAVEPIAEGGHFRVQTPHALVEVVGTRFRVEAGECTRVKVTEGAVRVRHAEGEVLLRPGDERRFCGARPKGLPGTALMREALDLIASGQAPDRAQSLLRKYLKAHPRGGFAEDALYHLALLQARGGAKVEARASAERFLRRYGGSHRAPRMRALLEE